jgi:hypothetical protein
VSTVTVTTDRFLHLAELEAKALGRPDLRLLVAPHPIAGLDAETARSRGRKLAGEVQWPPH